ncbi:hypothetical protein LPB86_17585 [Pedobacter sp. MC2016-14]|uniref:hypothetical protein n=1 Tax=Pedobacter sp. MC2016-14 TaxID=2897327 RepID=UPI001E3FCB99|nr:hypothetical protein [Pedobacter sp. MC2016-14]MCD0490057.1 hypothetical protein [Pedobacter sp. MC2016-14]
MNIRPLTLKLICSLALCTYFSSFAQTQSKKDSFSSVISKATGDLNKDQLPDFAIVTQDTLADTAPYRLQIFFGTPGGGRRLVVNTTKAITPQHVNGKDGYRDGNSFSEVTIAKNVLTLSRELLRGGNDYKFRYQNGSFELIGFSESVSDGQGHIFSTDFNLSTNTIVHEKENYETSTMMEKTTKTLRIRPLPKLQDFDPDKLSLY